MTAIAEHVLDSALAMANLSPWGKLCPPMLACLDELPSTAPLPSGVHWGFWAGRELMPDLAFTALGQTTPVQHQRLR